MSPKSTSTIVSKCMTVLDVIAVANRPLRFTELVSLTGYAKSSLHRILVVLENENAISHDAHQRSYRLGPRLLGWAQRALTFADLPSLAADEMAALNEMTDAHVALAILDGESVLYLKCVDSHQPLRTAAKVGERGPIHCTAVGKAIAAFLPRQRLGNLLAKLEFEQYTEHTIVDRRAFMADLENTKTRGFAVNDREEFLQIHGIAAPLFDHAGDVAGALSLWDMRARRSLSELRAHAAALRSTAERVSRLLGYSGRVFPPDTPA